jgi:hypothetical protein
LLSAVAVAGQLIDSFGILLSLTFPEALSLERLLVYLRQHAAEGSALGTFKRRRAALSGSGGHQSRYLGSKDIRKVLVELAIYNRTHYFCQMPCLRRSGDYIGAQPAEIP